MFDVAYMSLVDEKILVDELFSFDLNSMRDDWFRYCWVICTLNAVRCFSSTHGGY